LKSSHELETNPNCLPFKISFFLIKENTTAIAIEKLNTYFFLGQKKKGKQGRLYTESKCFSLRFFLLNMIFFSSFFCILTSNPLHLGEIEVKG